MQPLLFLVHRMPFPPNKGDKLRSFHLLELLSANYDVHLATFVDDADDLAHVAALGERCASFHVARLTPATARIRSLAGFAAREALTLPYYRDRALAQWVRETVREHAIRKAVVFSSAMAQYVDDRQRLHTVVDFVDVDSAKWTQYARSRRWPFAAVYAREGARLLDWERAVARRAAASVFVTAAEADLFRRLAPECAARVVVSGNGVDARHYAPDAARASPYAAGDEPIVFTGAMDYWPNIDAVCWFAREAMPSIAAERARARFYIVGTKPAPAVQALARDPRIVVTGKVDDVRPYLQHAHVVVAPLRVARGIQNKVLEAMAMARPVVVSAAAAAGVSARAGTEFDVAEGAEGFARATLRLMRERSLGATMGTAARARVAAAYDWSANLAPFVELLEGRGAAREAAEVATTEG